MSLFLFLPPYSALLVFIRIQNIFNYETLEFIHRNHKEGVNTPAVVPKRLLCQKGCCAKKTVVPKRLLCQKGCCAKKAVVPKRLSTLFERIFELIVLG